MIKYTKSDLEEMMLKYIHSVPGKSAQEIIDFMKSADNGQIPDILQAILSGNNDDDGARITLVNRTTQYKSRKKTPNLPKLEHYSISLQLLRDLEEKAIQQKANLVVFLQQHEIDPAVLNQGNIDTLWVRAEVLAQQRFNDSSLYKLRQHKYRYRVYRDTNNHKIINQYIGKELPMESLGISDPEMRFNHVFGISLKELLEKE
ncbi:MAG: hypothetical protein LKI17_01090 [Megasphaera cerevisiae]|jgi:hypothetical protein|nr:hypothetical protein [Megasphaera cerevisiae]